MLLDLPSWAGLATAAFEELRKKRILNYSQIDQLKALDPKKQLSIAYLIAEENSFNLDLGKHLTGKSEGDGMYKLWTFPIVPMNYFNLAPFSGAP